VANLADIIQLSENDRIAYELRPRLDSVVFKGRPVTTDSRGFRSPEIPDDGGDGALTIVGIGDSIMFGHGVGDGEFYLDHLRALLRERHPEVQWRVVNTAAPGYNTVMEVETLREKALRLDPDLVVLGVCGNDYAPPIYVRAEEDPLDPSRSFLIEFVRDRWREATGGPVAVTRGLAHLGRWRKRRGEDPQRLAPPRYAGLYGRQAFLGALDRLRTLSHERDLPVIALATITYAEPPAEDNRATQMLDDCRARGFHCLDMQPQLDAAVEAETGLPFSVATYRASDLVVSRRNGHPSVRQHRMVAEELYRVSVESGILERLLGGPVVPLATDARALRGSALPE